jgi:hypothetical protein
VKEKQFDEIFNKRILNKTPKDPTATNLDMRVRPRGNVAIIGAWRMGRAVTDNRVPALKTKECPELWYQPKLDVRSSFEGPTSSFRSDEFKRDIKDIKDYLRENDAIRKVTGTDEEARRTFTQINLGNLKKSSSNEIRLESPMPYKTSPKDSIGD